MKRLGTIAVVLMLIGGSGYLAACSRNTNATADTGDRVSRALKDANLNKVNVDWDKDANVVHLQGTVDNSSEKERAEQVAESAVGTSGKVMNELKVEGMDETTAADQDKLINDTIKQDIDQDQVLRDRTIHVDVNNGVVTITGKVRTPSEKEKVSKFVKSVGGVKNMANELEVVPKK